MKQVNVGILGSGEVARSLAKGFLGLGHPVKLGSRDPKKLDEWLKSAGDRATTGTFSEAARFGDLIILATLGTGTEQAIQMAGPENFKGKVVIDTTNPLDFSGGMPPKPFVGQFRSLRGGGRARVPR